MKIIVYSKAFFPSLGGLERNSYTLCNTLLDLGYEVSLITETLEETDSYSFQFKVIRTTNLFEIFRVLYKSDFLIINGGISAPLCLMSWFLSKKYAPLYVSSNVYRREGNTIKTKINNWIRKGLAEKAAVNICLTHYAANQLSLNNKEVRVIYNPIDNDLLAIAKGIKEQEAKIKRYDLLFAGRIIKGKGVFLLAEAVEILKDKYNLDVKLAYAGEGPDLEDLRKTLAGKNISVAFLGVLDKKELLDAYSDSKLLVVPSTSHIEGNPLVITEALTVGTPVIVSDQPAMVEIIQSAGLVFQSGDAGDLAKVITEGLKQLLQLEEKVEEISSVFSPVWYKQRFESLLNDISNTPFK